MVGNVRVGIVRDENCPGWELSGVGNCPAWKCPGWEMSKMRNIPDGKLSIEEQNAAPVHASER